MQCAGFSLRQLLLSEHSASVVLVQALELNSCGAWAWWLCGMWDLPGSGLKPVFPAVANRFFTTEPPGKPYTMDMCLKHEGSE